MSSSDGIMMRSRGLNTGLVGISLGEIRNVHLDLFPAATSDFI